MAWTQVANIRGPSGATGATGAQGPTGAPGVGFTWRGTWSASTPYAVNDCVLRTNQSYVCTLASTGNDPATDTTHWALMAGQGGTGPSGATGAAGPAGTPVISYSTAAVTLPPIGSTVSVTWDQTAWMMVGLPIALGDSGGNLIASFKITSLTPATNTTTLTRTA